MLLFLTLLACVEPSYRGDPGPILDLDAASTLGREHVVVFNTTHRSDMPRYPLEHGLTVFADGPTVVTVTDLGSGDEVASLEVRAELPGSILLPEPVGRMQPLRVTSSRPVEVRAFESQLGGTSAALILPTMEAGAEYLTLPLWAPALAERWSWGTWAGALLVALEPDTHVRLTNPDAEMILQRGEVHRVGREALRPEVRRVASDRPVALFAGGTFTIDCSAGDETWEQLLPVERLGTSYLAAPPEEGAGAYVLVAGSEDDTRLTLDDCGSVETLDAGEWLVTRITTTSLVQASRPILAGLLTAGDHECPHDRLGILGDPALSILTPLALHRGALHLGPLDDTGYRDEQESIHRVVALSQGNTLKAQPDLPLVGASSVGGHVLRVFDLGAAPAVNLHGVGLGGVMYGMGPYAGYATHLGYDCEDCVPDLSAPADCL